MHTALQSCGVVGMGIIEFELRLHELVYPTTQRDVWVIEQIGIDRVHHTSDPEALAFELLIGRDRVAVIRLSQLLGAHFKQGRNRGGRHSCWLTLVSHERNCLTGLTLSRSHSNDHHREPGKADYPAGSAMPLPQQEPNKNDRKQKDPHAQPLRLIAEADCI